MTNKKYYTFPNQKIVRINKPNYESNYLTISNYEWVEASKRMSPNTFRIYLSLASNMNGYEMALSRQAMMDLLDISKDSYIRAVNELVEKKYLINYKGNVYDFYTKPNAEMHTSCMNESSNDVCKSEDITYASEPTEINNISNINNLNMVNEEDTDPLDSLSNTELISLVRDYENGQEFSKICRKYKLPLKNKDGSYVLTKNLKSDIDYIIKKRNLKNENQIKNKTDELGLSSVQCNELAKWLFDCTWDMIHWDKGELYSQSFLDTGIPVKELYLFLQNNPRARYEAYKECSVSLNLNKTEYSDYFDYLQACLNNEI